MPSHFTLASRAVSSLLGSAKLFDILPSAHNRTKGVLQRTCGRFYSSTSLSVNRVAVVTGGSRGIGLATAQLLASKNVRVALVSADKRRVEDALAKLPETQKHAAFVCDVKNYDSVVRLGQVRSRESRVCHRCP